ncbi:unnamed protein product [Cuscuta europaea]|uniref:Uncharacterized protein n=1 Tax=Cuscuta europaea TaxID=41803 RepID=A0A9P0YU33_CUSEU|nr:unnamed protein product [Cuscuta europaea]
MTQVLAKTMHFYMVTSHHTCRDSNSSFTPCDIPYLSAVAEPSRGSWMGTYRKGKVSGNVGGLLRPMNYGMCQGGQRQEEVSKRLQHCYIWAIRKRLCLPFGVFCLRSQGT